MQEIRDRESLLAIVKRKNEWAEGLDFFTPPDLGVQASTWKYPAQKQLRAHKHRVYSRSTDRTQEVVYVVKGAMEAQIYSEDGVVVTELILEEGDLLVVLNGGHGYRTLCDDTRILEVKNGPFTSVELDKEYVP